MKKLSVILLLSLSLLGGCASNNTEQQAEQQAAQQNQASGDPRDPIESFNRTMWDFNYDVLDKHILRPVTVAYVDYMPVFARTGLKNMAQNLEEPANTLNNLLQGKIGDTFVSIGRFLLNSTVGLLGAIDVASEIGLEEKSEDFGQTLGVWGAGTGPYIMLPAAGPKDVRSAVGGVADNSYFILADLNVYFSLLRVGINTLEARATLMEQEQQLTQAIDPYAFVKNAYFQNLEFKVKDGKVEVSQKEQAEDEELDDFLDDL